MLCVVFAHRLIKDFLIDAKGLSVNTIMLFNLIIPCSLLEGYGLIIIERVIAGKAKQSFTVRLPRRLDLFSRGKR
jgi:hypothetical protein